MKKVLSMILVIALILGLSAVTALADTAYNGNVSGIITSDDTGHITGSVTGDYSLTITGQFTSAFVNQKATFSGTVTGSINGNITGTVCVNGLDSLYGVITGTGAGDTVRLVGAFVQTGITGDFRGEIVTGTEPAAISSLSITSPSDTMNTGTTMQMSTAITPAGTYDILWSVYVDDAEKAWIDQSGLLHALKPGTVTVIANALDPSLATTTKAITIVDPETEVIADVDPTFTIIIPASVDFGTLVKDSGTITREFDVTAQGVLIEDGASIGVNVQSNFQMNNGAPAPTTLAYSLFNAASGGIALTTGAQFALFSGNGTQDGRVSVDTAAIIAAGSYKGTMVFTITYND